MEHTNTNHTNTNSKSMLLGSNKYNQLSSENSEYDVNMLRAEMISK